MKCGPSNPKVVSPTKQVFEGTVYYLTGFYLGRDGVRLHRAVWEAHHGPIPDGMHIHHVNEDRTDNRIENLEMLSASEHMSLHTQARWDAMTDEQRRRFWEPGVAAAPAWHRSPEGLAWHSENGKKAWAGRKPTARKCEQCGEPFESKVAHARYCHQNCKAKARRRRIKAGHVPKRNPAVAEVQRRAWAATKARKYECVECGQEQQTRHRGKLPSTCAKCRRRLWARKRRRSTVSKFPVLGGSRSQTA